MTLKLIIANRRTKSTKNKILIVLSKCALTTRKKNMFHLLGLSFICLTVPVWSRPWSKALMRVDC